MAEPHPADISDQPAEQAAATEARAAPVDRPPAAAQATSAGPQREQDAAFYRIILAHVNASIFALDRTGRFTLSEGGVLGGVGLRPGERVGQSLLDLYEHQPESVRAIRRALGGEAAMLRTTRHGRTYESWLTPMWDEAGQLTGVSGVALEITEHVRAAQERDRTIQAQQEAIRKLSTPVLQVRERLLILPIIGDLDAQRAGQLTEELLRAIRARRARAVVIDITGVPVIGTAEANHLVQTVEAARVLGATVIITGMSAEIARTLVTLGVDLGRLDIRGDLQEGIEAAERLLGYRA